MRSGARPEFLRIHRGQAPRPATVQGHRTGPQGRRGSRVRTAPGRWETRSPRPHRCRRACAGVPDLGSTTNSARWPVSSALTTRARPSRLAPRCATERSQPPVSERTAPVRASRTMMWKRSDSNPGRSAQARPGRRWRGTPAACPRQDCCREVHRRAPPSADLEEVEIGRPRLAAPGDARREHDALAVGTEAEVLVAAEGLRGDVGVEAPRQVDRRTGAGRGEGAVNRCARVPSLHVSQWRTKSRS